MYRRTSRSPTLNLTSMAQIVARAAPMECPIAYSGAPGCSACILRTLAVMLGSSMLLL